MGVFRPYCFFVLTFLITISASADTGSQARCKDVRLDKEGWPFEKIPVYDQEKFYKRLEDPSTGFIDANRKDLSASGKDLCYAVTASQLIDAHRFSKGDPLKKLSSPLSIALNHKISGREPSYEEREKFGPASDEYDVIGPGNPVLALLTNRDQRVCDQRWLENYAAMIGSTGPEEVANSSTGRSVAAFFSGTFDQIRKVGEAKGALSKGEEALNEYYQCRSSAAGNNLQDILAATKAALKESNPIPQAQVFLQKLCKDNSFRVQVPEPRFSSGRDRIADRELEEEFGRAYGSGDVSAFTVASRKLELSKKARMKETINQLLAAEKPAPVGIGYCHDLVKGLQPRHCQQANHTSVIIGQRWNGKACELLIRDSYGEEGCRKSPYPCDNGSMWIPMNDLIDHTSSVGIYWLE